MGGIKIGGNVKHLAVDTDKTTLSNWEARTKKEAEGIGGGKVETAALFDKNGKAIDAYIGDAHQVNIDPKKLNNPETEGATFTHLHPNNALGGTLSLQDLKVFAKSNWGEMRATSKQGQLYSIKANPNADREALLKWVNSKSKILNKNFRASYDRALKAATTPLKSGPHKGEVKLVDRTTGRTVYRKPMTPQQAYSYARQYSVGLFDRTYGKNLKKMGFDYIATKAGK